ncbi:LPXTG cell wall anchor domain-containing protein [Microbacterium sp. NPDC089695]|uniref:LPXTG cell wall anchor domain-containing protein n=1 Tax=Microbacterium sp. NPDC089695 TaxID=3364198 RepID=UPI0037F8598A
MNVRRGCLVGAASAVALLLGGGAAPAWAAPSTEVIQGQVLRLVSVADWAAASSLLPGERVQWDVAVSADAPDAGRVTLAVSATGDAPVLVDAELCMQEWSDTGCPGGATVLETSWSIPRDGDEVALADFGSEEVAHLRLFVALDPEGDDDEDTATDIRVHARGAGDSVVAGSSGTLPATGGALAPWAIGAGAALAVIGVGLLALRSRRDDPLGERGRARP